MRRSIILAVPRAVMMTIAMLGSASAQSVGVEVYAEPAPYSAPGYTVDYGYAPPVYGYYRDYDEPAVVVRPSPIGGCGEFRYWDGVSCVDARDVPPDVR